MQKWNTVLKTFTKFIRIFKESIQQLTAYCITNYVGLHCFSSNWICVYKNVTHVSASKHSLLTPTPHPTPLHPPTHTHTHTHTHKLKQKMFHGSLGKCKKETTRPAESLLANYQYIHCKILHTEKVSFKWDQYLSWDID